MEDSDSDSEGGQAEWVVKARDVPMAERERMAAKLKGKQKARALRNLKMQKGGAKYDAAFDVRGVAEKATQFLTDKDAGEERIRAAAIGLLRTSTMARAGDLANMLPQLFHDGKHFSVKYTSKTGTNRAVTISGMTLESYFGRSRGGGCWKKMGLVKGKSPFLRRPPGTKRRRK
jgi:hypothetical protein